MQIAIIVLLTVNLIVTLIMIYVESKGREVEEKQNKILTQDLLIHKKMIDILAGKERLESDEKEA